MENANLRKRKRRKTRKSLELRKKTRKTNDVCLMNKNTDAKKDKNTSCCKKKSNYITNARLTLHNKTVRSETVTRLQQLSESESNQCLKVNNNERDSSNLDPHTNLLHLLVQSDVKNASEKQNEIITDNDSDEKENMSLHNNINEISDETPKSAELFTPEQAEDAIINRESSFEIIGLSSPPHIVSTADRLKQKKVYDKFIDDLELYIDQKYGEFLKGDSIVEKCKSSIFDIYSENFCTKPKDNTKPNVKKDTFQINQHNLLPEVPLIHNPRDYIGHSSKLSSEPKTNEVVSSFRDSNFSKSSSSSISSVPDFTALDSSPSIASVVGTSPEYSYYPHRLN